MPLAHAQVWVGSTGTVDPNSTNLVKYINGRVELRSDAPVGAVAFIRYNVLPVHDLASNLNGIAYRILRSASSMRVSWIMAQGTFSSRSNR
jgi:hypothetical protein